MKPLVVAGTLAVALVAGFVISVSGEPTAIAHSNFQVAQSVATPPPTAPPIAPPAWLQPTDGLHAPGPDALDVRWLGVAGFEIRSAKAAILIDPYYSRTPLWDLLSKPVKPDIERIKRYLRPVQAVFVGHAHFDHLMDAPEVAKELHIPLYCSDQGERIAAAEGLPADLQRALKPGTVIKVGDIEVEAIESRHSDMATQMLAGGDVAEHVKWPMGFLAYRNGPVFGFLIHWRGRTLYHSGSAQILDSALTGRHADVVLQCLTGWTSTPHIFERVNAALTPRVVIPMHDDDFFKPLEQGWVENPLARRKDGLAAMRAATPGASIVTMSFLETVRLHAAEGTK
jgi:L-ascorbate metabolism protein UlaG (beta-lactamase superfamily)